MAGTCSLLSLAGRYGWGLAQKLDFYRFQTGFAHTRDADKPSPFRIAQADPSTSIRDQTTPLVGVKCQGLNSVSGRN